MMDNYTQKKKEIARSCEGKQSALSNTRVHFGFFVHNLIHIKEDTPNVLATHSDRLESMVTLVGTRNLTQFHQVSLHTMATLLTAMVFHFFV